MVRFVEVRARRVLRRYRYRDNWFWCRYSLNPYRGCQFACNYCDAITEKYLVHRRVEDFSRIIYVKTGAPELLGRGVGESRKGCGGFKWGDRPLSTSGEKIQSYKKGS